VLSIESPAPRRSPRRTQHAHFRAHGRVFGREAGGYGTVLDGVRFVAVLAADGARVGAKDGARDDPVRVFQVVCAVDRLRLAVVFAERAVGVEFGLLGDGFGFAADLMTTRKISRRGVGQPRLVLVWTSIQSLAAMIARQEVLCFGRRQVLQLIAVCSASCGIG